MGEAAEKDSEIVVTTVGKLRQVMREELKLALASVGANSNHDAREYLTTKEAAEHLQVTTRTITNLIKGGMPHHRAGHELRFKRTELDHWMATRKPRKLG